MTYRVLRVALIAGGLLASSSVMAAPSAPAAILANTCTGCHGTQGASVGPSMPTLGGMPSAYIVDAMKKFKSGERPSTIMGRLAKGFSDDDFVAMGEYFGKQKFVRMAQATDKAKVAAGKDLHDKNCKKCHQDSGREYSEDEANTVIGGQWLEYLQINMDEYKSGKRKMAEKMKEKMDPLSREDLDKLAHFYASQQ